MASALTFVLHRPAPRVQFNAPLTTIRLDVRSHQPALLNLCVVNPCSALSPMVQTDAPFSQSVDPTACCVLPQCQPQLQPDHQHAHLWGGVNL